MGIRTCTPKAYQSHLGNLHKSSDVGVLGTVHGLGDFGASNARVFSGEPYVGGVLLHLGAIGNGERRSDAAARFVRAGLVVAESPEAADGMIVVVEDAAEPALAIVREVSRGGDRRILAISPPSVPLEVSAAWKLIHAGAADAWAWDDSVSPLQDVHGRFERWATVDRVVALPLVRDNLVGSSNAWRRFLRQIAEAAMYSTAPVLVTGETGTGKELAARLIHTLGPSQRKEVVIVDCATIVPELVGSELFGHERGSYTGAENARDGAFAMANGGTLFLDEVGELALDLQGSLLRAVQEKQYKRVGGNSWQSTNCRLVCATNRDLQAEVQAGRFRQDLYYRIAGITCRTPPLRERREDIATLAAHFVGEALGRDCQLSEPVRAYVTARDYPGNVRDLRRLMHAMAQRHVGPGALTVGDVPLEERPQGREREALDRWDERLFDEGARRALRAGIGLKEIGRLAEESAIRLALAETGSVRETASRLAITERALQLRKAAQRGREESADET